MSEALRVRAERLKLARLLEVEVGSLPPMGGVAATDLARLREQMTDRLFEDDGGLLRHAAAATRLVPDALVALIARRAFEPVLCARIAAAIDPAQAIGVATRLPVGFLCDVAVALDPRRVAAVLVGVPGSMTVPVSTELARRGEHVTMGRFLAFIPDGPLAAAVEVLDDEALLRIAFVLEDRDRLDHVVGLLSPARVLRLLRCAHDLHLWPEVLDLVVHLGDDRLDQVADGLVVLLQEGGTVVDDVLAAARDADLLESLERLVRLPGRSWPPAMTATD